MKTIYLSFVLLYFCASCTDNSPSYSPTKKTTDSSIEKKEIKKQSTNIKSIARALDKKTIKLGTINHVRITGGLIPQHTVRDTSKKIKHIADKLTLKNKQNTPVTIEPIPSVGIYRKAIVKTSIEKTKFEQIKNCLVDELEGYFTPTGKGLLEDELNKYATAQPNLKADELATRFLSELILDTLKDGDWRLATALSSSQVLFCLHEQGIFKSQQFDYLQSLMANINQYSKENYVAPVINKIAEWFN